MSLLTLKPDTLHLWTVYIIQKIHFMALQEKVRREHLSYFPAHLESVHHPNVACSLHQALLTVQLHCSFTRMIFFILSFD